MTQRQEQILFAIIEQHAEVAAPVGSVTLAKLFNVSSATIRAEMAKLESDGLIKQPHTSAGRIPTEKAYRYYVNLIREHDVDEVLALPGVTANNLPAWTRVMNRRVTHAGEPDMAIRTAVDSLVEFTNNLGLATIGNNVYMSGIAQLFGQPEFSGGDVQQVAQLLDNLEPWLREAAPNQPLSVFIGKENPIGKASGCSLIISKFKSPYSERSYIGVLGPKRQHYGEVMDLVAHAGTVLEEALI